MKRVVIVGGGFGGLRAAAALKRAPVDITLVDRCNHHLFQPLLYQVATGGLSAPNIAAALRTVLKNQSNVRVLLGEVTGLDLDGRRVLLEDGALDYDTLVVATGMRNNYYGNDRWREIAPGLKTLEDALTIRRRLLYAFEMAEKATDSDEIRALLTFVVIGAGPTGVELAGTIGEMTRYTLRREFRQIDPAASRILLVDMSDRVLPTFPEKLSRAAERDLAKLGVEAKLGTGVASMEEGRVTLQDGTEVTARTILWAAGVKGSRLAGGLGAPLDRMGRVKVRPDLTVPGRPEVFVVGDLAYLEDEQGEPLPGVAPVAMQQGEYVARRIAGKRAPAAFRYRDLGSMATIGRAAAVADLGRFQFTGYPAWLAWLFVHLLHLVQFEKKVLVLFQWAWNYVTFGRTARIITERGEKE